MTGRVVLGRYRIVSPLARGGMGIIYLGRLEGAAGFAKPVVIKTVIPEGNDSRNVVPLFVREARILSNLEHPSIVGVLDFGQSGSEYVMVLEYVHGFHLGSWFRFVTRTRGKMPLAHGVEALLPVLDALEFAHTLRRPDGTPLGIVHRDISPANILIDNQGHVKLHDFGIARMADDEFKTQDGTFRGTLSYTAPEILRGTPASPRSDLYSCGVLLHQLLSGVNSFKGQLPSETVNRILTHVPGGLRSFRSEVTAQLDAVVARAVAKDPAQRFESAGAFAAALRAARAWSEATAVADLTQAIQRDFNGPQMPTHLGLEPLRVRDQAWRKVVGPRTALSSSPPRRSDAPVPDDDERPSLGTLSVATRITSFEEASANQLPARVEKTVAVPFPRQRGLVLGVVGVLLLLGGGLAYAHFSRTNDAPAPQFLLIEKQVRPPAASVPTPTPDLAGHARSADPPLRNPIPNAPLAASPPAAVKAGSASGASSLSAAFQRQSGRVAQCFRANAGDFAEQPPVTVRFKIDGSGNVQTAELSPAAVSTSALGGCILSAARATHFPATGATVSFTVPITATRK